MRKKPFGRVWLRPAGRQRPVPLPGWLPALAGVLLALGLFLCLDSALREPVEGLAVYRFTNTVQGIVEQAVSQALDGLDGGALVSLERDGQNTVTALHADTLRINAVRSAVLEEILRKVEALDSTELGIPLGDLTGLTVLMSRGPSIPVRVVGGCGVSAQAVSQFSGAGINQTLHRLVLEVSVEATLLLPGGQRAVSFTVSAPLAETVVVGQVPSLVTGLTPGP